MELDTSGSDFAAVTAVYSGVCGSLTQVACDENTVPVTGGTTYYILVGALANVSGNLIFHLSFTSAAAGPPFIITPPASVTVPAGTPAAFAVHAEGAPPLAYFWQRNGAPIAGATNSAYTNNSVQLSDSGAQFSCLVSNELGVAASAPATLTVTVPGQLVRNGGFETGDFSYWILSGNTADTEVNTTFAHSGQFGAALGPVGSLGYLSQSIPTVPGWWYRLSLWLDSPDGLAPNEFSVAWNGPTLFDQVNLPYLG